MHQLISYLVVAEDNEAAFLATEGVLQGEMGFTTVAASWKVRRCDAISHGIAELLGREFRPIDGRGEDRQPSSGLYTHENT
jgi:hypothetical protein